MGDSVITVDSGVKAQRATSLKRVRRGKTLFVVGFGVLVLIGASFVAGRFTAAPNRVAIEQAQQKIDVYASVEERIVDSRIVYVAQAQGPVGISFTPQVANEKMVVRMAVSPGELLQAGALIGVVGGLPYFALPGALAPYRDLVAGDKGDDVKMLQDALTAAGYSAGKDGVVGRVLFNAVAQLYKSNGVEGFSGKQISTAQFVSVEVMPTTVLNVPKVGSLLGEGNPLLSVSSGAPFISLNANSALIRELTVGTELRANINGELVAVTVASVADDTGGGEKDQGGGNLPVRSIRLVPNDPNIVLNIGETIRIFGPGSETAGIAVPTIAILEDNDGTYVRRELAAGDTSVSDRVSVKVLSSGGGWSLLEAGSVVVGDSVRVST